MNNSRIYLRFVCVLFLLLVAAPVLAATVECPKTCDCLLLTKAKELGYSKYCGGVQTICGYDLAKTPLYCFERPATVTTAVPTVTTIPVVPLKCPSGCQCMRDDDAMTEKLEACSDALVLCGYDKDQAPLHCYSLPVVTTITTIPRPVITVKPIATTVAPLSAPDKTPVLPTPQTIPPIRPPQAPVNCTVYGFCMSYSEVVEYLREGGREEEDPAELEWGPSCGYSEQYQEVRYCVCAAGTCAGVHTLETPRQPVRAPVTGDFEPPTTPGPYEAGFTPAGANVPETTQAPLSGELVILALASVVALACRKKLL